MKNTAYYCRVSTIEQNTDRQTLNIPKGSKIYEDKVSGAIPFADRPQAGKLIQAIESGSIDCVVVKELDRLGRNRYDIDTTIKFLKENNCNLKIDDLGLSMFLDNGKENDTFGIVISVLGSLAELERKKILERQAEGIALAKLKGKYKGRPKGVELSKDEVLHKHKDVIKYLDQKLSIREIAKLTSKSSNTIIKVKKLLSE